MSANLGEFLKSLGLRNHHGLSKLVKGWSLRRDDSFKVQNFRILSTFSVIRMSLLIYPASKVMLEYLTSFHFVYLITRGLVKLLMIWRFFHVVTQQKDFQVFGCWFDNPLAHKRNSHQSSFLCQPVENLILNTKQR